MTRTLIRMSTTVLALALSATIALGAGSSPRPARDTRPGVSQYNDGVKLMKRGKHEKAQAKFEAALAKNPNMAEAHNNLGVALRKQGQISEAAKHYYKALHLDPNYAVPHYNLGLALFKFGKVKKAIYHFRKALQINPAYGDAQKSLKMAEKIQGH